MSYRGTSRASVDVNAPSAWGACDRCGCWVNIQSGDDGLSWQFQYSGNQLCNTRLLVCRRCLDIPHEFNRPVILPPDPMPIQDARPEPFDQEETPTSAPYPPPQTAANLIQAANEDEFS